MKHAITVSFILIVFSLLNVGYSQENKFAKEWKAYQELDKKNPPTENGIVFIGSSTFRMWKTLVADMAPLPVMNRGFGGAQVADAVECIPHIVLPYKPRVIVYYVGDNDVKDEKADSQVPYDGFVRFVQAVRKELPQVHIMYVSIKPSPKRAAAWPLAKQINTTIAQACAGDENLSFIDISSALLDKDSKVRPELFLKDQLHMTPEGYAGWTPIVKSALEKVWAKVNAK